MTDNIVPLRFNVEEVGKHVKGSKKRFTWEVSLNNRQHAIILDFSFISGKVKVAVDRKILLQNQLPANTSFQYPFTLDGYALNVIQQGDNFQLRVNNKVFSHLYNQMKTNKQFKKYEDQIKDIKVNENQFQAKKLTLNIGGVGGGMKKKQKVQVQVGEGHSWNAFGDDQLNGFPNYFQGSTVASEVTTQKSQVKSQNQSFQSLLDDQNSGLSTKQQQKPQNILDFQAELQKQQVPLTNLLTGGNQEFNTMQMMFASSKISTPVSTSGVIVTSNEVDFFNNQQEPRQLINIEQPKADIFACKSAPNSNEFNTMQYLFTTNQTPVSSLNQVNQINSLNQANQVSNFSSTKFATMSNQNSGFNFNEGSAFNTTNAVNLKNSVPIVDFKLQTKPVNQGFSSNTQAPVQQATTSGNQFNTMQYLFSTNTVGAPQTTQAINNPVPQQMQTSINSQHFATQQNAMQNFGTSFGINAQNFGTQNLQNKSGSPSQSIDFLGQNFRPPTQNTQPVVAQTQPITFQTQNTQPTVDVNSINLNDYSSMQLLFKTNSFSGQTPSNPVQPVEQLKTNSVPQISNPQQFNSGINLSSSNSQSPNMMYMNTYSGTNGSTTGLNFDLNMQGQQQFSTSANIPMTMKKQQNPAMYVASNVQNNSGDLL